MCSSDYDLSLTRTSAAEIKNMSGAEQVSVVFWMFVTNATVSETNLTIESLDNDTFMLELTPQLRYTVNGYVE